MFTADKRTVNTFAARSDLDQVPGLTLASTSIPRADRFQIKRRAIQSFRDGSQRAFDDVLRLASLVD